MKLSEITPKNIRNFIEGNTYHAVGAPAHIDEQAQMRMAMCQPCLKNGRCLKCGCATPNMFFAPKKVGDSRPYDPTKLKNLSQLPQDPGPCPWKAMVDGPTWEAWKVIATFLNSLKVEKTVNEGELMFHEKLAAEGEKFRTPQEDSKIVKSKDGRTDSKSGSDTVRPVGSLDTGVLRGPDTDIPKESLRQEDPKS